MLIMCVRELWTCGEDSETGHVRKTEKDRSESESGFYQPSLPQQRPQRPPLCEGFKGPQTPPLCKGFMGNQLQPLVSLSSAFSIHWHQSCYSQSMMCSQCFLDSFTLNFCLLKPSTWGDMQMPSKREKWIPISHLLSPGEWQQLKASCIHIQSLAVKDFICCHW